MNDSLDKFKSLGMSASFHYAGDMSEFYYGRNDENQALELFDQNPELRDEMRVIAKEFLWALESSRPVV
jgi:hypothetical protein